MKAPKSCHITESLPSYALFTGSGSLNASNTSSSHLPTKFSQLRNLRTSITSSPFNVLAVLALHLSLRLLGHFQYPLRSFRYDSPCLWNQLPLSLRKPHSGTSSSIFYSPIPSPITSSSSDSPLCASITPYVFHSLFHSLFYMCGPLKQKWNNNTFLSEPRLTKMLFVLFLFRFSWTLIDCYSFM